MAEKGELLSDRPARHISQLLSARSNEDVNPGSAMGRRFSSGLGPDEQTDPKAGLLLLRSSPPGNRKVKSINLPSDQI